MTPEEIREADFDFHRRGPLEYKGCKINLLDTPGAFDFTGEVMEALRAADAAIIVCSAKDGISVGLKKSGNTARSGTCLALSISPRPTRKTATTTPPSTPCGRSTATRLPPWWCPCGTRTRTPPASSTCSTSGPMSCRTTSGWKWTSPPTRWTWSPSSTRPLKESVAETSEEMMDKYFGGEAFTYAEMIQGLRQGVRSCPCSPSSLAPPSTAWVL